MTEPNPSAEPLPDAAAPSAPAPAVPATAVGNRIEFTAQLESFQGPLDLLLYLIKESEVEITQIPISRILQQYLTFLDAAAEWDLHLAGEFLVMATTLMEIKSRELLPRQEAMPGEEIIEDPRSELVRQLLRYRQLKDQARALEEMQEAWNRRHPRGLLDEIPEAVVEETGIDPSEIDFDLYELFTAFEKLRRAVLLQVPKEVGYEGETLEQKIERIEKVLLERPFTRFAELVGTARTRDEIAMTFVALLELVRRRMIRIMQQAEFGDIEVKVQTKEEAEEVARQEAQEADGVVDSAIRERAEREAKLQAEATALGVEVDKLPWKRRRAAMARPKFEGIVKPEDLEEIDAEEAEIARRIDAILAAADAISQRFEDSRGGVIVPEEGEAHPPLPAAPAPDAEEAPLTAADLEPKPEPEAAPPAPPAPENKSKDAPPSGSAPE
ncbi:MAG: segregation/condensation protein A [Planctomycetes bacterium]|nr:segregation/condensation protein A [Planctomycetota bacterium]